MAGLQSHAVSSKERGLSSPETKVEITENLGPFSCFRF
jgi:hypothetical protein